MDLCPAYAFSNAMGSGLPTRAFPHDGWHWPIISRHHVTSLENNQLINICIKSCILNKKINIYIYIISLSLYVCIYIYNMYIHIIYIYRKAIDCPVKINYCIWWLSHVQNPCSLVVTCGHLSSANIVQCFHMRDPLRGYPPQHTSEW